MVGCVKGMLKEFPQELNDNVVTPASEKIFDVDKSPKSDNKRAAQFHKFITKSLFVSKRARPDTQAPVAFLCTRVQEPTEQDWYKLVHMMKFLNWTIEDVLTLLADDLLLTKWCADASFAAHPDHKSHTGYNLTMGEGSIISACCKQKLNTRSSTEAELVGFETVTSHARQHKRCSIGKAWQSKQQ